MTQILQDAVGYSVDDKSNNEYFIIYKDGEVFTLISKRKNSLETIKKHFGIKEEEK